MGIWEGEPEQGRLVSNQMFSFPADLCPPLASKFQVYGRQMWVTQGLREPGPGADTVFLTLPEPCLILGHDLKQEVPLSSSKQGM